MSIMIQYIYQPTIECSIACYLSELLPFSFHHFHPFPPLPHDFWHACDHDVQDLGSRLITHNFPIKLA